MASIRKRCGSWHYRFVDAAGVQREHKAGTDRREAERMAAHAETEAAKVRAGLVDPKQEAFRDYDKRPITEHLDAWRDFLHGKGSSAKHTSHSHMRAASLIEHANIRHISDLTPSRVQAALKAVRDEGKSLRTVHHYMRTIKGFSRWLLRDGRSRGDALAFLTSPNPQADRRRVRRSLTIEELIRLVEAAEQGPVIYKLPGCDRAALYRVALGTGFRASELASLTPESFDLDALTPTITAKAAYSKRRRDDAQPIPESLAATLRPWLASKAAGQSVFPIDSHHTAEILRRGLESAGIPYETDSGVADSTAYAIPTSRRWR